VRKAHAWFHKHARLARFEARFGQRILACVITAAIIGIIMQATVRTKIVKQEGRGYQPASAPAEGIIVAVRLVPQASAADITKILDAYNASLVNAPRPGGLLRLRIGGRSLSQGEVAKIVGRIAQEQVVEFVAPVR
jgi:hypothetical protein